MANKHLSRAPKHAGKDAWWYEVRSGIEIFFHCHDAYGRFVVTKNFIIPWRQVRKALGRKDRDA